MRASKHVLALMLALVWPALGSAAETMRAISFIPKNDPVLAMANAWVAEVNAKLGSQLRINYVGGPEVIGRFQQVEALRTGVIDVIFVPSGDYQDQMPAAQTFVLSKLTPSEERKSGFYDFMVEEHAKKINARYLGRVQISPFYLWTKKEPKTIADLRGLKMRSGVLYDKFMRELGMVAGHDQRARSVHGAELRRGRRLRLAGHWPAQARLARIREIRDRSAFLRAEQRGGLMNLDKFNALPEAARNQLITLSAEFEPKMVKHFDDEDEHEWKEIGSSVTKVKFSPQENERYLKTAYEVEWAALQARAPELIQKLRSISGN